jgi:chromosome segregation protein
MYLKSIEMKGFKSFADRINLAFDKGIAAIVGPNGSGKSNIADGVRWVLGEQSVKALRGNRMEDVIFAGTDSRKALGFAEVSITIDNRDGFLPIEYSEVMVTRRVFRSGESEYYLNKTGCRLKDINELFMDTGVGKEGYSIIGQGRIDEILSSKAEDRRKVFEEAAGIVKYKTRKEEAERKMQRTRENLLRLGDIIEELQKQIGPLQIQSEIAKSYIEMRNELKRLELSIFVRSIERLDSQKTKINEDIKESQRMVYDKNVTVNRLEADFHSLETRIQQIEEELKEIQDRIYLRLNLTEKKEGEIKVLVQKIQSENESINMHKKELVRIEHETEGIEEEKQIRNREIQDLKLQLEDKKRIIEAFQANLDSIGVQVGEEEERAEQIKAQIIENLNGISDLSSRANSLKTLNETIYKRKVQLLEELQTAEEQTAGLKHEREELKKRLQGLGRKSEEKTRQRDRHINKLRDLRQQRQGLERKQRSLEERIGSDRSKLVLLKQMEKDHEGYSRSVRGLIEACGSQRSFSKGIIGPVAELINVKPGLEKAIEIALGYSLQSIVTKTEEDAKSAIEFLKSNALGRATFLPVSSIKARYLNKHEEKAMRMKGCIGSAAELVDCPRDVQNIVDNLLGRVIIVDCLDSGIQMARSYKYGFRIVTVDGDVINTGGSMSGGSSYSKEAGLLQRKGEIQKLDGTVDKMAEAIDSLEKSIKTLLDEEQDIDREIQTTAASLHGFELEITRLKEVLEAKDKEMAEKESKILQLESEKTVLETDYYETQSSIEKIYETIKEKETENRDRQEIIKNLQRISSERKQDKEYIAQQITANRVEAARLGQKLEDVQAGFQRAVSILQRMRASVIEREKEIEINKKNILKLENEISSLRQEIAALAQEKDRDNEEMVRLQQTKAESQHRIKEKEQANKEMGSEISELQKKLHRHEVQLTKVEMELNSLHDRMWEEYELTHIQAVDYKCDIQNEKKARTRINELKGSIKELGNINMNAIEEYARVKERFDFLNTQREDLEEARDSLNKIIDEMLDIMKKKFSEQFEIINESFNSVFRELFGGGKAQVILADRDNILESGIDIIAQPPGKKLQQLSLLSGGEKALAAIALLFAILSVKPSPFCMLDEIEAALDDANVERFGAFLKKLSADIQFVVITHRKGTMEIANNLYGVTMEEKGISKLVSVKLEDMVS